MIELSEQDRKKIEDFLEKEKGMSLDGKLKTFRELEVPDEEVQKEFLEPLLVLINQ